MSSGWVEDGDSGSSNSRHTEPTFDHILEAMDARNWIERL